MGHSNARLDGPGSACSPPEVRLDFSTGGFGRLTMRSEAGVWTLLVFFEWLRLIWSAEERKALCFFSQDFAQERLWHLGNSHIIVHISARLAIAMAVAGFLGGVVGCGSNVGPGRDNHDQQQRQQRREALPWSRLIRRDAR